MREIPVTTRTIRTENGHCLSLQYILLIEKLSCDIEIYGIKITGRENSSMAVAPGLTVDSQRIYSLIELLASNTVTPAGLMDVLTDWLNA